MLASYECACVNVSGLTDGSMYVHAITGVIVCLRRGGVGGVECMTWSKHLRGGRTQIRQVEGLRAVIMGSGSPSTAPSPERISCCGGRLASLRRAESTLPFSNLQTGSCLYLTGVTSCLNIQPP